MPTMLHKGYLLGTYLYLWFSKTMLYAFTPILLLSSFFLSGCLLSERPNIPVSQLSNPADIVGEFQAFMLGNDSKNKGEGTPATIKEAGNGQFTITIKNQEKDGKPQAPTVYKFRLLQYQHADTYIGLIDEAFGEETAYSLISREEDGSWLIQLFSIMSNETNIRAQNALRKYGIGLDDPGTDILGANFKGQMTASTILKVFNDRDFINELSLRTFYRLTSEALIANQQSHDSAQLEQMAPPCKQEWQIYPSTRPCGKYWDPAGKWKSKYWCYTDFNYSYGSSPGTGPFPTYCIDKYGNRSERRFSSDPCKGKEGWCDGWGLRD